MSEPSDMSDDELIDAFIDAMRSAPRMPHVEIETDEGVEIMFYGAPPELRHGGTLFIPRGAFDGAGPVRPDEETGT
jgi:hypothetical protein